ncbi:MAG: glycine cleavage system aminomethyltransferase GcvT [Gemmataceae bacterium]
MALRTPLHNWHVDHGATMVDFAGWEMPIRYASITEEHQAVRGACGLFDVSHMARLNLVGPGAFDLVQRVWTNNAATMRPGQVRYGLVCNDAGGILDDILVYCLATGWSLVVNASNRARIVGWLDAQRQGLDVQVIDRTESTAMLAVQGPRAVEVCSNLLGLDVAALKYYFAAPGRFADGDCLVSRTGYTGEDGFEVVVPAEAALALADALAARGARPCGLGARDTLRLEAAMPLYGHELDKAIDPLQAGLGWAVKLDKGPFVGRESLLQREADRTRPVRVGLEVEGRRAARERARVLAGEQPVGIVTSGTITPTLGKAIAMGYVQPAHAAPGTKLSVEVGKSLAVAQVVSLPFYRRPRA